ncbi:amino acid ABC transporter permease [Microbacterium sp. P01]|uniref:amino acid ABC transporter permease n=1 Tax=unclassified Microbacterium TaxID=2609290 RepID=UPI00366F9915
MSSVLYDVPGPRAITRNRILGAITIVVVLAILGFILWRFAISGQFSAEKWSVFTYVAIWEQFGLAALRTLAAFGAAAVGAVVLGFVLAIARLSDHAWVRVPATVIVEVLRAVPVLVLMLFLYFGLPVIDIKLGSYWSVVIALVVYNGAVISEILRAGIESLPRGQKEAGYAVGLRKSGVMQLILLPQAIRAMLPVIIAQLVVTLKDTALGFIITYPELLDFAKKLGSNALYGSPLIPSAIIAGAIYIGMCLLLSWAAVTAEKRMRRSPRVIAAGAAAPLQDGVTDTSLIVAQQDGPDAKG